MPGKFETKFFSEIPLDDPFFDSLKQDYPEFATYWFPKCAHENRQALVFSDEQGLGAFIAMKPEDEPLVLQNNILPACPRIKISTLRLAERYRGKRLGEGALGLILWKWQHSSAEEIYVTVFRTHKDLITQLERFGFVLVGDNERNEHVYLRSRKHIDFSNPYKAFPFISPTFKKGGYLIVEDRYHDTLFPYSEVQNLMREKLNIDVANGVSKIYVGRQWQVHYRIGEPVFIYRKYTGMTGKRYRSCLTSFGVITKVVTVKQNGIFRMSFDQFCSEIRNKSIFSTEELQSRYNNDRNITMVHLLYCGYFGCGNNINCDWLDRNGLWCDGKSAKYPADIQLSPRDCLKILNEGKIDIANVFGNK